MRGSIATLISKPEMGKVVFCWLFSTFCWWKTVINEVIIVHKLVPFMINFRGFLIKQAQLGCCHAIVLSNRQNG